jgi:hypothetical protein
VRNAELRLQAVLRQSNAGGSGAFLGLASDGERYWIKPLNNAQGQRVPITEQIVGRAGQLVGAPTCVVRTIAIEKEFAGWEFRPGHRLEAGIAHASHHVADAVETRTLDRHVDDDNARRYIYVAALYDWCWGGDVQGLMAIKEENRYYSHDHGWYLPPEGANWTVEELEARANTPHELAVNDHGSSAQFCDGVAATIEALKRNQIRQALSAIPASWPVTDDELECVGFFLEKRACAVAERIRRRSRSSR